MIRLALLSFLFLLALGSAIPPPGEPPRLGYEDVGCLPAGPCPEVVRVAARGRAAVQRPAVEPVVSEGSVRLVVSIPQQKLWVFEGGELIATSRVSTGKRGHETPVGRFRILQKKVHHRSNRYSNAPMPYMQRLTNYGIALHGGHVPGYPASHGCIRLPHGFARKLYGITGFDTRVTVTRAKPRSAREALAIA